MGESIETFNYTVVNNVIWPLFLTLRWNVLDNSSPKSRFLLVQCKTCHQTGFKGLAKLGNIVAESMFLVMFPGVAKLGNICFGRKICVRKQKCF